MQVTILYNGPSLPTDHPDYASEAGVMDSVAAFEIALRAGGHVVDRLALESQIDGLLQHVEQRRPDVVVNFCESFAGQPSGEPYVASLLEMLGVAYTGGTPECLALVRDKVRTKWLLRGADLPTAAFARLKPCDEFNQLHLRGIVGEFPWFVKPAAEDASLGISTDSVVCDWRALVLQVDKLRARFGDVLVERYIGGREFNVGVVGLPDVQVLPLAEICFAIGDALPWPVVTYESKWDEGSAADLAAAPQCPANVEPALGERIRHVALAAFNVTGCRDYARVDLRVTAEGEIFILEVNGNPDAGPGAGLARALRVADISYEQFALRLVETARQRGARAGAAS